MKKKVLALLMAGAMVFSITACGSTASESSSAAESSVTEASSEESSEAEESSSEASVEESTESEETADSGEREVTVTDMSGDEVTITGEVKSIVNLWPAGTSSFFVMGAGDMIKGLAVNNAGTVNSWSKLFYPEAGDIPALGGTTPTVEDLLNLDPDLVIIHPIYRDVRR